MSTADLFPRASRLPRLFLVTALAAGGVILQFAPALADRFEPIGDGWTRYINERFGTSFQFPEHYFTPQEPPTSGDGRTFTGDEAALEIYSWENSEGETAASLKRRLVGSDGYTDVTYSPAGPGWLVLSGFRSGGETIFYEKYFFKNGVVSGFGMEFPRDAKPTYAPMVERIEDTFEAGSAGSG